MAAIPIDETGDAVRDGRGGLVADRVDEFRNISRGIQHVTGLEGQQADFRLAVGGGLDGPDIVDQWDRR